MGKMERPPQVENARHHADYEALSAMGRKGAEHAAINREVRKEEKKKRVLEAAAEKAKTETISPEGDVLPPDPEILATFQEEEEPHG